MKMKTALRGALLCSLFPILLAPGSARALCIDLGYAVVAFSSDGDTVLLEELGSGPEGGGSVAYLLVSATAPGATRYLLSSTYSPGDGSEPEAISKEMSQRALRALGDALKKKKVPGVQLRADAKRRSEMVTTSASTARGAPLRAAGGELVGGNLRVRLRGRTLAIQDRAGGVQVVKLDAAWGPLDSMSGISGTSASGGKLLVLLRDGGHCRKTVAVLHTSSGRAGDLRTLTLPR